MKDDATVDAHVEHVVKKSETEDWMGTTNIIWQKTRIHEDSSQVINCTSCGLLFSAMNANKDHTDRSNRETAKRV